VFGSQPRARVHERCIPGGEGDGDTGRHQGAMPRREAYVITGMEIHPGVARVCVARQR